MTGSHLRDESLSLLTAPINGTQQIRTQSKQGWYSADPQLPHACFSAHLFRPYTEGKQFVIFFHYVTPKLISIHLLLTPVFLQKNKNPTECLLITFGQVIKLHQRSCKITYTTLSLMYLIAINDFLY